MTSKTGVALYGSNGHQIQWQATDNPRACLIASCGIDKDKLPGNTENNPPIKICSSLEEILALDEVELVSLCSPVRRLQAKEAIACMEAGKHVYAEKPCAMTEQELDEIIKAAERTGMKFHEMAGTAFEQPWRTIRDLCLKGEIGDIIQIFAQKSYPYHDKRPQDEDIDGGLLMQVGVHAARFIEHLAGVKIKDLNALESKKGSPQPGELRMACAVNITLECGGIATFIANYCNSHDFGSWGNEEVRIFGTKGFIEGTMGGRETHLYMNDKDCGPIKISGKTLDYFEVVLDDIRGDKALPLSLEEELSPTRAVIRAKASLA